MKSTERIIANTGIVYIKLILSVFIGLFTTRLTLAALGEVNYGIYILVAGVINMLSIFQSTMTTTTLRFISYNLGKENISDHLKIFNTSLFVHFLLGLILILILEIGGKILFAYGLNIPSDKIPTAWIVFQFMIFSSLINVVLLPFEGVIIAHENFTFLSIVDFFTTFNNLIIAIYLTNSNGNLLILYAMLVFVNQVISRAIKQWYARKKYLECKVSLKLIDKYVSKKIFSFSIWTFFGSLCSIIVIQSKNILLNIFFGVKLNAANGVSQTVTSYLNNMSVSLTQAINPQIFKNEGSGRRIEMLELTTKTAKFSLLLFCLFGIPFYIETPFILHLWLKTVPEFVIIFIRLMIINMFFEKITFSIETAINAVGKIKQLNIVILIVISLNIPLGYLFYKNGFNPTAIYFIGIFISILTGIVRLFYGRLIANLDVNNYLKTLTKSVIPIIISFLISFCLSFLWEAGFIRLVITTFISISIFLSSVWYIGLSDNEQKKIKDLVNHFKKLH